jgi:hypothetical protein
MEMLRERHNDPNWKYTKRDLAALYQHMKSELKRIEDLRAEGKQGRIEFEPWD